MFLDVPNQASRYQGTLLKTGSQQVFQQSRKPEPYYLAALALYRFEVATRKLSGPDRSIKSFRYYLLLAFRCLFEAQEFPGPGHKKVGAYCTPLVESLSSVDKARVAFDASSAIVQRALSNLNLTMERDNAKSRLLIDEIKKLARAANPAYLTAVPVPN